MAGRCIDGDEKMLAFQRLGESSATIGSTDQRIALPSHLRAALGDQRNSPARRNIRINDINAAGEWRRNQQLLALVRENRAVVQTVFRPAGPLPEIGAYPLS